MPSMQQGQLRGYRSKSCASRSIQNCGFLNVECYGRDLARGVAAVIEKKLDGAHEVTLAEVDARTIPGKLRDAAARLFSPFL